MPPGRPTDLFDAAADHERAQRAPLASRMRPRSLDDVVGQRHLLRAGAPFRTIVEADRLSSAVFCGPPGTGKTTVARLVADVSNKTFVQLSAVSAGVKEVREVLDDARRRLGLEARGTILFLDEIHRFSRSQQDALLPGVEDGTIVLIGATTENPFFALNAPLLSRSTLFRFEPLSVEELGEVAKRTLSREGWEIEPDALAACCQLAEGDARAVLTSLEVAIAIAAGSTGDPARRQVITISTIEAARTTRALRFGPDDHYDVISALIKSIRGSDPDAGVYWLARLLAVGEDPRFIARRLVILASEDIGLADPTALLAATAAAAALDRVGLPEAALNLAQAVLHLSLAPKSNATAVALSAAQSDIEHQPAGAVPSHLRDAHYRGAAALGHGTGYEYPHDDPRGWVDAVYLPDELVGSRYYRPTGRGLESELLERLSRFRDAPSPRASRDGRTDGGSGGPGASKVDDRPPYDREPRGEAWTGPIGEHEKVTE